MQIQVHLHGILRDQLPPEARGKAEITLEERASVKDLLEVLGINRRVVAAVNDQEEVDHSMVLHNGDHVVLFVEIGGGCAQN
jgi:sulfur carrier protein ThiS